MNDTLTFDEKSAKAFRRAYKLAVAGNKEVFIFQGKEVLTAYAKHVCDYLVMQGLLPKEGIRPK